MANIYTEREVSNIAHSTGTPGAAVEAERVSAYGKQLEAESQRFEKQAQNTYSKALSINANETMASLYQQFHDDPVALQDSFKKAYDKAIGQIVDDDVKVAFMADVSIKQQPYITKAIENKKKKDYRIAKSTTFNGIDSNTKTMGLAFSTLLGDDFNPDNIAAYNMAYTSNNLMIDTLNDDGTFMFTDEQRREKRNAMDKVHLSELKDYFDDLEPYQQSQYNELLDSDKIMIPSGIDENKEIVFKNLKDVVSPTVYDDYKEHAKEVLKRAEKASSNAQKVGRILSPEEAKTVAIEQIATKARFLGEDNWKKKGSKTTFKGNVFDAFNYRRSLIDAYNNDALADSDYNKMMADIENVIVEKTEDSLKPKGRHFWNDCFNAAITDINKNLGLNDADTLTKAAAYSVLYDNFVKFNQDPEQNNPDNWEVIDKIVQKTTQDLMINNDPTLLGVNAQRILSGASLIKYNQTEPGKTVVPKNYVLKKDSETGTIYKVFRDKNGNISDESPRIILKR